MSQPRFATCDDDLDYCIKHDEAGEPVRANEWICTWLARAVGLAIAMPAIVQDLDGKLLFGSQIFGDDTNDNMGLFTSKTLHPEHIQHIWKTYIVDLFVRNQDRHVNQYKIFTQNRRDRIISFDFGSSLFSHWPDLLLPLPPHCNTMQNIRWVADNYTAIDMQAASTVLDRLDALDGAAMVAAIKGLPRGWLDRRVGTAFTSWFGGRGRRERVAQIREGLRNGSYL
jgi:hypothetical protein